MKTKFFKYFFSACLAAALMILPTNVFIAAPDNPDSDVIGSTQTDAIIKNKEEVIYATLASEGNVHAVYAVNHFELSKAGNVKDYGSYSSITNLTNTNPLTNNTDSVSFHAQEGNFYYQGNMGAADLPWKFDLSYYLNGVKTAPPNLAGKSGKLEIRIATKPNESINPVFYENYMLQITITLDTEKCSSIDAPDATIASAGKNTIVTYTVMPEKNADISLTADALDFTMSGIQISGMPLSINMESPDTENMTSDFEKLSDAISDLNDGVSDMVDGMADLKTGAGELKNGSAEMKTGLSQLSNNSGELIEASAQINIALSQIVSSLENTLSGETGLDDLNQLPQGLTQLSQGLKDVSGGLIALKDGFTSAYAALDAAIQGIPDIAITQAQIDTLYANTDPSQHSVLDALMASYTAGQTVKETYSQGKDAFDAVAPTINTLSGSIDTIAGSLDEMSSEIEEKLSDMDITQQLEQLSSGLSELSNNYADFHSGLVGYMDGVSEMAAGYADFHSGLTAFRGGVSDFYDGVVELHDGTAELNDETGNMPDQIQSEIDDLIIQYTGSDFKPVSFISSQNTNVSLVQFVFKCDGIEKQEAPEEIPAGQKNETIWDRFIALFKGKVE